jgi:hypothetical protein
MLKNAAGLYAQVKNVDPTRHPVLYNLVAAFSNLEEKHAKINGNYKLACIFENGAFRSA